MCGIKPGQNILTALSRQDEQRIAAAEYKIANNTLIRRQKLRSDKKKKNEKGTTTYFLGAFGLSATIDIDLGDNPSKNKKKSAVSKKKTKAQAPNKSASDHHLLKVRMISRLYIPCSSFPHRDN